MTTGRLRVPVAARLIAVVGAVVAATAGAGVGTAPAATAAAPCVGVIVDASRAGGAVRTGCARTDPTTGFAALRAAGFAFRLRPDGLLCQINAQPADCAASTQRYWSYWYRASGSSRWVYSNLGPGARNPKPGSTEGWVFQVGGGRARPPAAAQSKICPAPTRAAKTTSPQQASTATRRATAAPRRTARAKTTARAATRAATPRRTSATPTRATADRRPRSSATAEPKVPAASAAASGTSSPPDQQRSPGVPPASATTSAASSRPDQHESPGMPSAAAARSVDGGSGGGLPLGVLAGIALVVSIATAAVLRDRSARRR